MLQSALTDCFNETKMEHESKIFRPWENVEATVEEYPVNTSAFRPVTASCAPVALLSVAESYTPEVWSIFHPMPVICAPEVRSAFRPVPTAFRLVTVSERDQCQIFETKKTVMPKKFLCHVCDKTFISVTELKSHVRVHNTVVTYMCDICSKIFKRNEDLTRHKKNHTWIKPYACPVCYKQFFRKDHCKKHIQTHYNLIHHTMVPKVIVAALPD